LIVVTEKQKMLAGEMYDAADPELTAAQRRARDLCRKLNALPEGDPMQRDGIIRELFGHTGDEIWIEPPFYCDYGSNITLGRRVFFNFNCVVLDPAPVTIGSNVMFGPAVQIYTATHPLGAIERRTWREYTRPVAIGSDVWVGGAAVINPGVHIGARSVIGADSVVTGDIPADVFAAGNPCRIIRGLAQPEHSA
jgi:maltose O-acetyltransferase